MTTKENWVSNPDMRLPLLFDSGWDKSAAVKSLIRSKDNPDWRAMRRGHMAYNAAEPKLMGSYKLPFAKRVNGRIMASYAGVRAVRSRFKQSDLPADVLRQVDKKSATYMERFRRVRRGRRKVLK